MDEIRPWYDFDVSCQGSCPQAIEAFLEGEDFEDVIRKAISIGGDSDTIACMAGGIAEAYFGIPDELAARAMDVFVDRHSAEHAYNNSVFKRELESFWEFVGIDR